MAWIIAVESLKVLYVTTCSCEGGPFTTWFFQAFHHWPYTFWWTYHGLDFLAGPYSLIWWILNAPGFFGYYPFFAYLWICDIAIFALLYRRGVLYSLYFLSLTLWFTTVDPVDYFIIAFAVYGRYRAVWLLLAPITKLPIGAPAWVWQWTFSSSNSFAGPENWGRYLILGTVWGFSLLLYLGDKTHAWTRIHNRLSRLNSPRTDRPAPDTGPAKL